MTFENYISALFYLNETIQYCTIDNLRLELEATKAKLLDEAFKDTQIASFMYYAKLKSTFSELFKSSSIKNTIKKTSLFFYFHKELTESEKSSLDPNFDENGHLNHKIVIKIKLICGELEISSSTYYYNQDKTIDINDQIFTTHRVELKKCTKFSDEDFATITQEIDKRLL